MTSASRTRFPNSSLGLIGRGIGGGSSARATGFGRGAGSFAPLTSSVIASTRSCSRAASSIRRAFCSRPTSVVRSVASIFFCCSTFHSLYFFWASFTAAIASVCADRNPIVASSTAFAAARRSSGVASGFARTASMFFCAASTFFFASIATCTLTSGPGAVSTLPPFSPAAISSGVHVGSGGFAVPKLNLPSAMSRATSAALFSPVTRNRSVSRVCLFLA